MSAVKKVL
ncbi:UNVERIFIED_CONTAM: hypothetical protein GTU68_016593 [Idotea baltica]|nr:hypothetical protein [Idotea baltica]